VLLLSPSQYDEVERLAMSRLPNRAIEACKPTAFQFTDYPTRISDVKELWRYADVMHDRRAQACFERLGSLTSHEYNVWLSATREATAITEAMGRRIVPKNAPLAAIAPYRAIKSFFESPSVFEVGPGSGYLGKYLISDGVKYLSTDVTQAFCLWQNTFFGVAQMPWWEWIDHNREDVSVDVVIANHALNELNDQALRYLIVRAERMLGTSGVLIAEQLGAEYLRSNGDTIDMFVKRGWQRCDAIGYKCNALVPPGSKLPPILKHEDRHISWDDLDKVWQELGGASNPDDEFQDFIGSTIS
jgi:hypothetical protein